MIVPPPAGWRQHSGAHVMVFEAPGGAGSIRAHVRLPLAPLSQLLGLVLEGQTWVVEETSSLVTAEGEFGALSRVTARGGMRSEVHFVACVFADDFAVALDAAVLRPDAASMMESVTRELVMKVSLGLGTRRRRFVYTPPRDWFAVPTGLWTSWYPPGFPDDHAQIVVYPAEPTQVDPEHEVAQLLAAERERGARTDGEVHEETIEAVGGLSGRSWSVVLRGPGPDTLVYREIVSFSRAPYRYALKLESRGGPGGRLHRPPFLATAKSVVALPVSGQQRINAPTTRAAMALMQHWAE